MLRELGRLEEAEASLRQAIAVKSDFADAHYNLGINQQELGRLEEAEVSFRRAISLKNDYKPAIAGLGKVLLKKGQHKEGLANLRKGNGAIFFNFENGITIQ